MSLPAHVTGRFRLRLNNWPRLVNYWTPNSPGPHPWFKPWSTVLGELGTSYFEGAAHLDLSPRATNSRKNRLRSLFVDMLQIDSAIWIEALRRAPNCRLVLAAGSATNRDYINQFISKMLRLTGVRLEAPCPMAPGRRRGANGLSNHLPSWGTKNSLLLLLYRAYNSQR